MSQGMIEGPDGPTVNSALSRNAQDHRMMGIHEHAALVQAIMLNFPEIYEEQAGVNLVRKPVGHGNLDRPIEGHATA